MGITNASSSPGCGSVTIQWTNDSNATAAELDDPGGNIVTRAAPPPRNMSGKKGGLHRGTYTFTIVNSGNVSFPSTLKVKGTPDPHCTSYANGFLISSSVSTSLSSPGSPDVPSLESVQHPASADALISYNEPGDFVLVTPQRDVLNHYTHAVGSITQDLWQHVHTLKLPAGDAIQDTAISLIQNTPGKFEVVARATPLQGGGNDFLVAYELQGTSDWQGPVKLIADAGPIDHVTGAQAFIESDDGIQSQFELLVPRGAIIYHYTHETATILEGAWKLAAILKPPRGDDRVQVTAIALNQSPSGTLEAIARVTPAGGGDNFLVGYEFNSKTGWTLPFDINTDNGPIHGVTGNPALFQNDQNTFALLVPQGTLVYHYTHEEGSIEQGVWKFVATLNPPSGNDQALAVSVSLTQNPAGNLELVARQRPPAGQGEDFFSGYEYNPAIGWSAAVPLVANDGPIVGSDSQSTPQPPPSTPPNIPIIIAIVAVILILVGIGIWWFVTHNNGKQEPPPVMHLSSTSLAFTFCSASPPSQSVTVTNSGGGTLTWQVHTSSAQPLLTVTPTQGSDTANASTPLTFVVSQSARQLKPGNYTEMETITSGNGTSQTVTVALSICPIG